MRKLISLITKSTFTKIITAVICAGIIIAIAVPVGLNAHNTESNNKTKKETTVSKETKTDTNKSSNTKTNSKDTDNKTTATADDKNTTAKAEDNKQAENANQTGGSSNEANAVASDTNENVAYTDDNTGDVGDSGNNGNNGYVEDNTQSEAKLYPSWDGTTYFATEEEQDADYWEHKRQVELANGNWHLQATDPWQESDVVKKMTPVGPLYTDTKTEGNTGYAYSIVDKEWMPVVYTYDNWITWCQ